MNLLEKDFLEKQILCFSEKNKIKFILHVFPILICFESMVNTGKMCQQLHLKYTLFDIP